MSGARDGAVPYSEAEIAVMRAETALCNSASGECGNHIVHRFLAALDAATKQREEARAMLREARSYVDEASTARDDPDDSYYASQPEATEPAKALLAKIDAALAFAEGK